MHETLGDAHQALTEMPIQNPEAENGTGLEDESRELPRAGTLEELIEVLTERSLHLIDDRHPVDPRCCAISICRERRHPLDLMQLRD